jgi:hypothetical protein
MAIVNDTCPERGADRFYTSMGDDVDRSRYLFPSTL